MSMDKIVFGDTGFMLPQMGLGMAALGRPEYINLGHGDDLSHGKTVEHLRENAYQVLDLAFQNGVRYFDTAQSYGNGELFLKDWISRNDLKENDLTVGSKWGYTYTANWKPKAKIHEVKDHSHSTLARQYPISRRRLSPHLKIYQIHSATFESGVLRNFDVLDYLGKLKEKGLLVGLSVSGQHQGDVLKEALKISFAEERLFDVIQVTYNLLERKAEEAIQSAYDQGVAILIKEGVANGRLTARNTKLEESLISILTEYNCTLDALALSFISSQSWRSVVLSGATNRQQLASNLKFSEIELSNSTLKHLSSLAIDSSQYWKQRSLLTWN